MEEMKASKIIDLQSIVGICPICSTGSILVHQIDDTEGKVLASLNGENQEWCNIEENEGVTGFYWGELFIHFSEVMRV